MNKYKFNLLIIFIFSLFFYNYCLYADGFKVVVLGNDGGPRENNISGYLIASKSSNNFVALDAGSLLNGIYHANKKNSFEDIKINCISALGIEIEILQNHIKGYLISHAHLDHIAGLVLNSTADKKKSIFGIDSTINFIRDHIFNWQIWPNFGSEGKTPILNQYQYQRVKLNERFSLPNTDLIVEAFLLNHNCCPSTAFLIEASGNYVLYFGDTAPDSLCGEKHMEAIWKRISPLIQQNKLLGIFLECSYGQEETELYGHLNSKYMIEELTKLATLVDLKSPNTALKDLKVIVTHVKGSLFKGKTSLESIQKELKTLNNLGLIFLFPKQGEKIEL